MTIFSYTQYSTNEIASWFTTYWYIWLPETFAFPELERTLKGKILDDIETNTM
jgi:hypothetical protein